MKIIVEEKAKPINVLKCGVTLSAKAFGYYVALSEIKEENTYGDIYEYLKTCVGDGRCAVRSGIKELIEKCFLRSERKRTDNNGRFAQTEYILTLPGNKGKE